MRSVLSLRDSGGAGELDRESRARSPGVFPQAKLNAAEGNSTELTDSLNFARGAPRLEKTPYLMEQIQCTV